MSPLVKTLRESRLMLRALTFEVARLNRRAAKQEDPSVLTDRRAFYALERRMRDYLEKRPMQPMGAEDPALIRAAFPVVRDALALVRDHMQDPHTARDYNARLNHVEKLARCETLRSMPLRAYYEMTNQCNLRCRMCGQFHFKGENAKRDTLCQDTLNKVAPVFKWMRQVSLFGFGESLLVPWLEDAIRAVPDGTISHLITNGVLLNDAMGRMFVDAELNILCVSVDATAPETYKKIRGVDKLEHIQEQVRRIRQYRDETGAEYPRIHMLAVLMRDNIEQLPEYVRKAAELGADEVSADYLIAYSEEMRPQSLYYEQEHADRIIEESIRVAEELGIQFHAPVQFAAPVEKASRISLCYDPWEFVYFRADGFTAPCCINIMKFPKWTEQPFEAIWNGEGYRSLRRNIHTQDQPEACRDCYNMLYRDIRKESAHIQILPESRQEQQPAS